MKCLRSNYITDQEIRKGEKKEPRIFKNWSIDNLEKNVIMEIKDLVRILDFPFSPGRITGTIFTLTESAKKKNVQNVGNNGFQDTRYQISVDSDICETRNK